MNFKRTNICLKGILKARKGRVILCIVARTRVIISAPVKKHVHVQMSASSWKLKVEDKMSSWIE